MIDTHTHILPDIDDGAKDIEQTIKMLLVAQKDGITDIIATPHISDNYSNTPDTILKSIENVKNIIKQQNININLHYGVEVYCGYEIFKQYKNRLKELTVNQKGKYMFLELPFIDIPPFLNDVLIMLKENDIIPIIVHPLRNSRIIENINIIKVLREQGVYFQINKNAVFNNYPIPTYHIVKKLINNNLIHIIASDAHSHIRRRPTLKKTYNKIKRDFGELVAQTLLINNPKHILYSELLDNLPLNKSSFFDKIKDIFK